MVVQVKERVHGAAEVAVVALGTLANLHSTVTGTEHDNHVILPTGTRDVQMLGLAEFFRLFV